MHSLQHVNTINLVSLLYSPLWWRKRRMEWSTQWWSNSSMEASIVRWWVMCDWLEMSDWKGCNINNNFLCRFRSAYFPSCLPPVSFSLPVCKSRDRREAGSPPPPLLFYGRLLLHHHFPLHLSILHLHEESARHPVWQVGMSAWVYAVQNLRLNLEGTRRTKKWMEIVERLCSLCSANWRNKVNSSSGNFECLYKISLQFIQ